MQYWSDLYIELSEQIIGLRNKGEVNNKEDLGTILKPKPGDAYKVKNEKNLSGDSYIFRYFEKKNEYGIIISSGWINTKKTSFEGKLPEIQWIDLWHDQVSFLTEELPFSTPAIFLGFSTIAADDRGLLVQDMNTQIDFYLFYETFSDTYIGSMNQNSALEYLDSLTKLHALFHGHTGENYASMRRVDMRREDSGGAGNLYRISFQCNITDYSAQVLFNESENPNAELEITPGNMPSPEVDEDPVFDIG